jgi:hypothetical protein
MNAERSVVGGGWSGGGCGGGRSGSGGARSVTWTIIFYHDLMRTMKSLANNIFSPQNIKTSKELEKAKLG